MRITSAFMPASFSLPDTHSAQRTMSSLCSERALTLGIRKNSSSSSWNCCLLFLSSVSKDMGQAFLVSGASTSYKR